MFKRYYQRLLFQTAYVKGLLAVFLSLTIGSGFYFFLLEPSLKKLKDRVLENNALQKHLHAKKLMKFKHNKSETDASRKNVPDRYFHLPSHFQETPFLMERLVELITGESSLVLKQIALKDEKIASSHRTLEIHIGLLGNYQTLTNFCALILRQPFFIQLKRLAIEKLERSTRGGYVLYADLLIHLYIFK